VPGYARCVRVVLLLLALSVAAAVAACGASAAGPTPIGFGVTGGDPARDRLGIVPDGSGPRPRGPVTVRRHVRAARVRQLRSEIQRAHLATAICTGSLPDFSTRYIRLGDRRFAVRGRCEVPFNRVFSDLEKAVALR